MLKLGIDFGSTYTTVTIYREDGTLDSFHLSESYSSPFIPTVVAEDCKNQKARYGQLAKGVTGSPKYKVYKAFKMLLSETSPEKLQQSGYDEDHTPAEITKKFLTYLLEMVAQNEGDNEIGRLVIGAPEIWFKKLDTLGVRSTLREICSSISTDTVKVKPDGVLVVSEPTAACAYIAENYRKLKNQNYTGSILLVDYGGGTLDISLAQVQEQSTSEDGINVMQIKVLDSNGAGENQDGMVGQAGILYMESVTERAFCDADVEVESRIKFARAVDQFETELQQRAGEVKEKFEECYGDLDELEEEEFVELEYGDELISVNYRQMYEVYQQKIYPVLDTKLDEMIKIMSEKGLSYLDGEQENFKIVLVGGFGNYYLVDKQLKDKFHLGTAGKLMDGIPKVSADREKAISYGAALLAAGAVEIRQTAPISIGLYQKDNMSGKTCRDYCFRYRQDIEYGKVYYPVDENGDMIPTFLNQSITSFLINFSQNDKTAIVVVLKEEMRKRIQQIMPENAYVFVVGFSLDSSEIISIHIRQWDMVNTKIVGEDFSVELAKYSDMFEPTRVTKI